MSSEESKKIMAENIKYYMNKKGVNNQQICDALNLKYTTFMDWIKGVTYPRIGKVEAMAKYFGVLKSDLIERKTEQQREAEKKNDKLASIIVRMRYDEDFLSVVETLYELDADKVSGVKQMLNALLK